MSVLSWRTERCAPRRSSLVVSSATQRSTRFSHDELVGVKCRIDESRVRGGPALDRRRLVCGGGVQHEVDVEVVGDLAIERLEEPL
jgi:hypothetical protein